MNSADPVAAAAPAAPRTPSELSTPVQTSAPAGPAPTGIRAQDASTRDGVLSSLLRHGELTAAALADLLGVSVQAMRRHLRGLEDEGLVQASTATRGPGRPSNRWQLTTKAQAHFPDGSEDFALGLLESMAGALPAATIEQLLTHQAHQKAAAYRARIGPGPLPERLEHLVDLRRQEGFVAECSPDPEGNGWLMREFHCSVMRIAEQFPCVCDQELRLIRQTFPDCQVERVQWRLEKGHSCGFRLRPADPGAQGTQP
ncbi:MAG: iron-sulfur cluster biosynthesis transcriptional regulator SufR [Synechococcaceae cyanobacterium]